jgi:hypothetical protein
MIGDCRCLICARLRIADSWIFDPPLHSRSVIGNLTIRQSASDRDWQSVVANRQAGIANRKNRQSVSRNHQSQIVNHQAITDQESKIRNGDASAHNLVVIVAAPCSGDYGHSRAERTIGRRSRAGRARVRC